MVAKSAGGCSAENSSPLLAYFTLNETVSQTNLTRVIDETELEEIIAAPCDSHAAIDNVLRSYLGLTTKYKGVLVNREFFCGERFLLLLLHDVRSGQGMLHIYMFLIQQLVDPVLCRAHSAGVGAVCGVEV